MLAEKLKQAGRTELAEADIELPDKPERLFPAETQAEIKGLDQAIEGLMKMRPSLPKAMAVSDGKPTDLKVHLRGSYLTLGRQCSRGFPAVLGGDKQPKIPPESSGRLELAKWLTRPDDPLTSRVFVNRVWRWLFGRGIVGSVDNFGSLGEQPANPALLDWLATTFVDDGWSLKRLIRRVMLSQTYQMSSRFDARAFEADPDNKLCWRHSRRRLEAEETRDAVLMAGGQLDRTMGGSMLKFKDRRSHQHRELRPGQLPHQSAVPLSAGDPQRAVRGLHRVRFRRSDGDERRPAKSLTVAPQALFMMNSPLVLDAAKSMAQGLLARKEVNDPERVRLAFQTCYGPTHPLWRPRVH